MPAATKSSKRKRKTKTSSSSSSSSNGNGSHSNGNTLAVPAHNGNSNGSTSTTTTTNTPNHGGPPAINALSTLNPTQLRSLNTVNSLSRLAQAQPPNGNVTSTTLQLQALEALSRLTPDQQNKLYAAANSMQQHQTQQTQTAQQQQQQSQQQSQQHRMLSDPEFLNTRSPFYETISRHCVMPICHKQRINFQFNLPRNYVSDVHAFLRATQQPSANPPPAARVLHIRLYDLEHKQHTEWKLGEFELKINSALVQIPHSPEAASKEHKLKEQKEKACRFVQPLEISQFAREAMNFELKCFKNQFYGAASIEIVNVLSVEQIAERVIARSKLTQRIQERRASQAQNVAVAQKCQICGREDTLSRCSRCKAVWYCTREHQQQDWNTHGLGCMQHDELQRLRLYASDPQTRPNEDEVVCDQMVVSVRDPISLCKIATPVRGTHCYHPSCVDLNTYLHYCRRYRLWQCPICARPLRYRDLVVDESMRAILGELDDDIDQVRLNPDNYSYKVITAHEQREQDNRVRGSSSRNRKRKHAEITALEDGEVVDGAAGAGGGEDDEKEEHVSSKKSKPNTNTNTNGATTATTETNHHNVQTTQSTQLQKQKRNEIIILSDSD